MPAAIQNCPHHGGIAFVHDLGAVAKRKVGHDDCSELCREFHVSHWRLGARVEDQLVETKTEHDLVGDYEDKHYRGPELLDLKPDEST